MSEWYRAVENTVSRSADAASTVIALSCLRHAFLVRSRRWGNRAGPMPQSFREVLTRLLDSAQREADAHLDALARFARAGPHQAERPQGRRTDVLEREPGAAGHEPPVVPEHLAPGLGVALDVDGERRSLDDDLALGDPRADRLEVRPQRDGLAVRDRQAAEREVDHDARVAVARERVPVHRALRPHGELGADAGVERRGVVPRFRRLVDEAPVAAELVERLEHRRDAEVVVVLADRSGARLLEVRESGCHGLVVDRRRHALGAQVVSPVARGVGARVRARRDHPEGEGRPGMRVAHLRLRPPPRGGDAAGRRQVGDLGADERIDPPDHATPVRRRPWEPSSARSGAMRGSASRVPMSGRYGQRPGRGLRARER